MRGGVLCPRHGEADEHARPLSLNALKTLRFLQIQSYAEVQRLKLQETTRREIEAVMHRYIMYILERKLKSVDFMRAVKRMEA